MQAADPSPNPTTPARRAAFAGLALALFAAFFLRFANGVRTLLFRDHLNYFLPVKNFLAGGYAWWCPGNYLGMPAYGDPQFGFWYPPSIMFRLLPFPLSYNLHILLHFFIIGLFALLLARRWFTPAPALLFAVGVTGCGLTLSLSEFSSYFGSYAWLYPILFVIGGVRTPGQTARLLWLPPLFFCALTAGGTLFLAVNLLLAAALLLRLAVRNILPWPRLLLLAGLTLIVCFPPAYYYLELYLNSSFRQGYEFPGDMRFFWSRLPDLFLSGRAGWPRFLENTSTLYPFVYCGAIAGILLLYGLRRAWPAALAALAVITVATGTGWSLLTAPVAFLHFRFPEKLLAYAAPLLFFAAATGLQRLRASTALKYAMAVMLAGELFLVQYDYLVFSPYRPMLEAGRIFDLPAGRRTITIVSWDMQPIFPARDMAGHNREQLKYRYGLAATLYGLESYLGYSPAKLAAYGEVNRVFSRRDLNGLSKTHVLRNAGIDFVIGRIEISPTTTLPQQPLWERVIEDPRENLQVFKISGALPRAALFPPEVTAAMRTADDLTGDYPWRPVPELALRADGLDCSFRSDTPLVLVVNSFAYPGMELTLDGEAQPVTQLAFGMYPALPIPPGDHRVTFRYRPSLLELNSVIFLAGLAGCLFCARSWRRRNLT